MSFHCKEPLSADMISSFLYAYAAPPSLITEYVGDQTWTLVLDATTPSPALLLQPQDAWTRAVEGGVNVLLSDRTSASARFTFEVRVVCTASLPASHALFRTCLSL